MEILVEAELTAGRRIAARIALAEKGVDLLGRRRRLFAEHPPKCLRDLLDTRCLLHAGDLFGEQPAPPRLLGVGLSATPIPDGQTEQQRGPGVERPGQPCASPDIDPGQNDQRIVHDPEIGARESKRASPGAGVAGSRRAANLELVDVAPRFAHFDVPGADHLC